MPDNIIIILSWPWDGHRLATGGKNDCITREEDLVASVKKDRDFKVNVLDLVYAARLVVSGLLSDSAPLCLNPKCLTPNNHY